MSSKSAKGGFVGLAVTPSLISGVRLATQDLSVISTGQHILPAGTLSSDNLQLTNPDTFQMAIAGVCQSIMTGNPPYSETVFLSLLPPVLQTEWFSSNQTVETIHERLLDKVSHSVTWDDNDIPLLQAHISHQTPQGSLIVYSAYSSTLINTVAALLQKQGLTLAGIDMLPFALFRGLGGSGVVDALLGKIGHSAMWGCVGRTTFNAWISLWCGNQLLKLEYYPLPADEAEWQRLLLHITQSPAGLFTAPPIVWLVWDEPGQPSYIDWAQVKVPGKIIPAKLGPYFSQQSADQPAPSILAVGSALKSELSFPWGQWEGFSQHHVDQEASALPLTPIQPGNTQQDFVSPATSGKKADKKSGKKEKTPKPPSNNPISWLDTLNGLLFIASFLIMALTGLIWWVESSPSTTLPSSLKQWIKPERLSDHLNPTPQVMMSVLGWVINNLPSGIELTDITLAPGTSLQAIQKGTTLTVVTQGQSDSRGPIDTLVRAINRLEKKPSEGYRIHLINATIKPPAKTDDVIKSLDAPASGDKKPASAAEIPADSVSLDELLAITPSWSFTLTTTVEVLPSGATASQSLKPQPKPVTPQPEKAAEKKPVAAAHAKPSAPAAASPPSPQAKPGESKPSGKSESTAKKPEPVHVHTPR